MHQRKPTDPLTNPRAVQGMDDEATLKHYVMCPIR